jgi:DNA-binding protein HU-beta/integration host factor subunit alpha
MDFQNKEKHMEKHNVSKKELAIRISRELGKSAANQQVCLQVIQRALDDIMDYLKEGRTIEFRNFGVFEVCERKARLGRNPKRPDEAVPIPAHKVVAFRPGKEMKAMWK